MTNADFSKATNTRGFSVQQRLLVIVTAATAGIILLATVLLFGMRANMLEGYAASSGAITEWHASPQNSTESITSSPL